MSRIARILFTPEILIGLTRGTFRVSANPVPETATLRYCANDLERGAVSLVVEDASFEDVPPGGLIPLLEPVRVERLDV